MPEGIEGVSNFSWVSDDLAGMALPRKGVWPGLVEHGVGAVLSLTHEPPPGDPEAFGLAWRHQPIEDFGVPTPEEFDAAWAWVQEQRAAGRRVVVHCRAGCGRTGMVLAAFLAADGMRPEEAVALVRRRRPGSIETPEQELFVHTFAARHAGRRG
jgi:atypical dual specificity phosphatase